MQDSSQYAVGMCWLSALPQASLQQTYRPVFAEVQAAAVPYSVTFIGLLAAVTLSVHLVAPW